MANELLHSPADVIAALLVDLALGMTPTNAENDVWPVYVASEPDKPDQVITVYDTAGQEDGRAQTTGQLFCHYGLQFRIRAKTPKAGFLKADEIRKTVAENVNGRTVHVDGTTYAVHALNRISQVIPLGKETPTSKRSLFTVNATVTLKKVT